MIARLTALLVCAFVLTGARGPVLVPDVSQDVVQIRGDFNGARLLLFGAINYPAGVRDPDSVDIIVVLKGPEQSITVREKQQVAGIWINAESSEFRSAPAFYALASSRPIEDIVDDRTADIYELGLHHLQLSPAGRIESDQLSRFTTGLVDRSERYGLYSAAMNSVRISDGILYRARIDLPARVPVGDYTAETFLIMDGRVIAAEVKDIRIEKTGMGRFITNMARQYGLLYGLIAVFMAVALGWLAGLAFRKF